jgi:hypothetical protein
VCVFVVCRYIERKHYIRGIQKRKRRKLEIETRLRIVEKEGRKERKKERRKERGRGSQVGVTKKTPKIIRARKIYLQ